MAEPTVRVLRDDERVEASRVVNYGMLGSLAEESLQGWGGLIDASACHGAFAADGKLVGLTRYLPTDASVPGGSVAAAGITAVAVLSTHRRQGHLTRLMRAQLDALAEQERALAVLIAAEWAIYGRFGYGPAVDACGFEIDAVTARFRAEPTGSIELVSPTELRPHLEAAHEARRARTPGGIRRDPEVWERIAGGQGWPGHPYDPGPRRGAIWRDDAGVVQGAVSYKVEEVWTHNRPAGVAEVSLLVGATPEAERELWRHLCEIDWVRTVKAELRGLDDPLPLLLHDGRAARQVEAWDAIWARVLDVPAVFSLRRPALAGTAVIEVVDPLGYANGRWRLDLAPEGSEVTATDADPDATLPVNVVGAACLGGRSLRRLQEAGWLDEGAPGGIDRLDALLSTPTLPWSPTHY